MTERDKAQETYQLYQYDRENGHDTYLENAEAAQRYYVSDQWLLGDRQKLDSEGRPMVTVNEFFGTLNSVCGELEQLSTDVRYAAGTGGDEDTAIALNKLSEHIDRQNKLYHHDERVRMDGMMTGRGFYEIRMEFDDSLQGNISISSRRPQNVILPCDMESPDPGTWNRVSTTDILSLNDIEDLYGPSRAADLRDSSAPDWLEVEDRTLASRLGINNAYRAYGDIDKSNPHIKQFRQVSMQYVDLKMKDFFVDLQTGDMSEIPENWSREKVQYALDNFGLGTRRKKAKTIRWRVVINDQVVHDEDSPYKYFTIVPFLPFFVDGVTPSLYDVLKGPQDLLNKSLSEEIHILATTANSGWKVKEGSLRNMTTRQLEQNGAKNGLVMILDEVDNAERITPGSPPAGFQSLSDRAQQWNKSLAGVTPSMAGNARADASGNGIRMQLLRAPVNLAVPLTAFHFTKHLMAERKLDLIQSFYTETRVLKITSGPYGRPEELALNVPVADRIVNDVTLGTYTTHILPTGSRMQAEEYAFDELVQLRELGITVPNSLFIATSSINSKADATDALLKANGGDLSPEEQRARELEIEAMELANADAQAKLANTQANTELAKGRAARAYADAEYDPRKDRAAIDRARLVSDHQLRSREIDNNARKNASDTAIKLVQTEEKAAADKAKAKNPPKKPSKPKKAATAK